MTTDEWVARARNLGPELAAHADEHDEEATFVQEAFQALLRERFFTALVPENLGGGGAGIRDICEVIRALAHACSSTALAFSMHSHLIAATVWRVKHGMPGEALLRKVVDGNLILVSTGAGDWLESNGTMEKVEGGYRYTSMKPFASGSPMGHLLITSGRYDDPDQGPMVLHFPLSLDAEGVVRGDDWDTHGMRGTGSDTVRIDRAFIPDDAISIVRPCGPWHPAFSVIATVALPIIMSAYTGIAERAADLAVDAARRRRDDPHVQTLVGELLNAVFAVRAVLDAQIANANEYDFEPDMERSSRSAQAKTLLADGCIRAVEKAMEVAGGAGFFRKVGIERLMRDVRAGWYHPLQPKRQHCFSGRVALGLDPA